MAWLTWLAWRYDRTATAHLQQQALKTMNDERFMALIRVPVVGGTLSDQEERRFGLVCGLQCCWPAGAMVARDWQFQTFHRDHSKTHGCGSWSILSSHQQCAIQTGLGRGWGRIVRANSQIWPIKLFGLALGRISKFKFTEIHLSLKSIAAHLLHLCPLPLLQVEF
jgi:hypothetical protein